MARKSADLGLIEIRGRKLHHWLAEDGAFEAKVSDDEVISADSLKKLKDKLNRKLAAAPLNIRFIELDAYSGHDEDLDIKTGVVVSIHSGNGNAIVRYDGETSTEQARGYRHDLYRGDTDIEEMKRLHKVYRDAYEAFEKFKQDHKLVIDKADLEAT